MGVHGRIGSDGLKPKLLMRSRARRAHHQDAMMVERAAGEVSMSPSPIAMKLWSIGKLKPAARRARRTSPAQLEAVIRSVRRYNLVQPVLVDGTGEIIAGHVVVEAAAKLDFKFVPVVEITHLSEAEVRGLRLALNRLGETGEWDLPALSMEVSELGGLGFDLSDTAFSLPELDILQLGDGGEQLADDDALPKPLDTVVSEVGDIWRLGDHRIICGDATDIDVYKALLGEEQVACVFGDPPFNIPIAGFVSGMGKTKHDDFVQGVGEWTPEEFTTFLQRYLDCCREVSKSDAAIFACMDWRSAHLLTVAGQAAGLRHMNTIIWNKGSGGMGGLYRSAHEEILLFSTGTTIATNNIALGRHGRDRCNVWNYPGANRRGSSAAQALKLHATPKPVPLVEDAICDVTKRGEIVLDPFSGSGTTLIAAHNMGRVGRAIELDPKFVDVTVRRFAEVTGIEPVHSEIGCSFNEMSEIRGA